MALSGHVDTPVTCTVGGRTYQASVASAMIQGYQVSMTVKAAPYQGPGDYRTIVSISLTGPSPAAGTLPAVPTTISATGGSVTISGTGDGGRTIAATMGWSCS